MILDEQEKQQQEGVDERVRQVIQKYVDIELDEGRNEVNEAVEPLNPPVSNLDFGDHMVE